MDVQEVIDNVVHVSIAVASAFFMVAGWYASAYFLDMAFGMELLGWAAVVTCSALQFNLAIYGRNQDGWLFWLGWGSHSYDIVTNWGFLAVATSTITIAAGAARPGIFDAFQWTAQVPGNMLFLLVLAVVWSFGPERGLRHGLGGINKGIIVEALMGVLDGIVRSQNGRGKQGPRVTGYSTNRSAPYSRGEMGRAPRAERGRESNEEES